MSALMRIAGQPLDNHRVLEVLKQPAKLKLEPLISHTRGDQLTAPGVDEIGIRAMELFDRFTEMNAREVRSADLTIAQDLHRVLSPLKKSEPWLLYEPGLWEWLALTHFRQYALRRWLGGDEWLSSNEGLLDSGPKASILGRFLVSTGSVKSHSRHVVRRLFLYADTCYVATSSYDAIGDVLPIDSDIPSAIFERKLGLSPVVALTLSQIAASFSRTERAPGHPAVGVREKRRNFFREVNLLVSTVALETLDPLELKRQLQKIASYIQEPSITGD